MQYKLLLLSFVSFVLILQSFFGWLFFAHAQSSNEEPSLTNCKSCTQTPEPLVRYISFVRSVLGTLQSTSKIDYDKIRTTDGANGKINTLIDYAKQEWDSYLWVFKREWRVINGDVVWIWFDGRQALKRDFFADFARQTVVWIRTSALTRDVDKLEELDQSIDTVATVHINNFVFSDPIPANQITSLQGIFSSYQDIFSLSPSITPFEKWLTYKDVIGWLNYTQRLMKNHVTFTPKKDFTFESKKGIWYTINPTWSQSLMDQYGCIITRWWLNCNPTYGKTKSLRKEFSQKVGKDFTLTIKKFTSSFRKLKALYNQKERDTYFGERDRGRDRGVSLNVNGSNIKNNNQSSSNKSTALSQDIQQQQDQIKKQLTECKTTAQSNPDSYRTKRRFTLGKWSFGKIVSCRELSDYEIVRPVNLSEAEIAKIAKLQQSMNDHMMLIIRIDEEQDTLIKLASPRAVTTQQPLLSQKIYETRSSLHTLIDNSIQWCLSFCSNLNSKVNCGSR